MAAAGFSLRTREYNVAINACRRAKKRPWETWERPYTGPSAATSGAGLVGSAVAGSDASDASDASSSAGMVRRLLEEMDEAGIKQDSFTISTAIMAYGGAGQVATSPSPLLH